MQTIEITTPVIRLDQLLKYTGAVQSGGEAKALIQSGGVSINGSICTVVRKQLRAGDTVAALGQTYQVADAH